MVELARECARACARPREFLLHIEDILLSYIIINIRHVVIKTLEVMSMADGSRARNVLVDVLVDRAGRVKRSASRAAEGGEGCGRTGPIGGAIGGHGYSD